MAGRIVVLGASGYTGRLVAQSLVERGERPIIAGRDEARLRELTEELGADLEIARADVSEPASVAALVGSGDVLVTTVGPFTRLGHCALEVAIATGAHYLDSTGEPGFIHHVFEQAGPRAADAGVGLLTAFGYDWVPGNLAGGLVLREAGEAATRVDIGYFLTGNRKDAASGGTRASMASIVLAPGFAWRDGRIRTERLATHVGTFDLAGKQLDAISVGGSEHFALPRVAPHLREVRVHLGWFGRASRRLQRLSALGSPLLRLPGLATAADAVAGRLVKGSSGGPDEEARRNTGSAIVAIARDDSGAELARVDLTGVNAYTFTGAILAWGAATVASGGLRGVGALGPVDGFGLDVLEDGCRQAGLTRA